MNRLLLIAAALLALTSGASAAELPQIPSVLRLPTPPAPSFELPALPPSPQPSLPSPTAAFGDRFGDWRLDLAQEVTAGLRPNQSGWDRMLNDPELLRLGHLRTIDLRGKGDRAGRRG